MERILSEFEFQNEVEIQKSLRPKTFKEYIGQEKLKEKGFIYMVTDWDEYAFDAFSELKATPNLVSMYDKFAPHQEWRPQTKFERKAIKEGRAIFELLFEKV